MVAYRIFKSEVRKKKTLPRLEMGTSRLRTSSVFLVLTEQVFFQELSVEITNATSALDLGASASSETQNVNVEKVFEQSQSRGCKMKCLEGPNKGPQNLMVGACDIKTKGTTKPKCKRGASPREHVCRLLRSPPEFQLFNFTGGKSRAEGGEGRGPTWLAN